MNSHKNKHIRAAVDYALSKGWRLVPGRPRADLGGDCIVPKATERVVPFPFSVRLVFQSGTPGTYAKQLTNVNMGGCHDFRVPTNPETH